MSKLIIQGTNSLKGAVKIDGAKNSILPILAASLLCNGVCVIHNCPNLSDVAVSLKILTHLGCKCKREGETVIIDASGEIGSEIPHDLMREMRSSIVFLGAILARTKRAVISSPGGCELGPRPVDLHILNLRLLGAEINEDHGLLDCNVPNGFKGKTLHLSFPSVGATENIMIAGTLGSGVTVIHNAAKEPEISDLADFLNSAGAKISGAGSDTIEITGVAALNSTEHTVIPDRIIAATYMSAAAACGGDIVLNNVMPAQMLSVLDIFSKCGAQISVHEKSLRITAKSRPKRIPTIRTLVYPGFPTDAGPPILAMLCVSSGTSVFVENIFQNRYKYIDELKRLGANIKTEGRVAVVEGVESLSGAKVSCTDLRGGAALVIAGLAARGTTEVDEIFHIKRGYADIVRDLKQLGADIKEE